MPVNCNFFNPATLTIAPSGAKLPFNPTTPPSGDNGLLYFLRTFCLELNLTFFKFATELIKFKESSLCEFSNIVFLSKISDSTKFIPP